MDSMNGATLAMKIRLTQAVPIIVCSSDDRVESLCEGIPDIRVADKTWEGIKEILNYLSQES
jgi:hypothetical protein